MNDLSDYEVARNEIAPGKALQDRFPGIGHMGRFSPHDDYPRGIEK